MNSGNNPDKVNLYATLVEQSNDAIYLLLDGRFVFVNQSFINLFHNPGRDLSIGFRLSAPGGPGEPGPDPGKTG
jgi:PAS domain-containing protein